MRKASKRYDVAWRRQVSACRKFIRQLENLPSMHGQKWKDSMLRHYRGKLKELLAQKDKPL